MRQLRIFPFTIKGFFFSSIFILVALFGVTSLALEPASPKNVDLQGHRGARGARPENTLPAFQYAIDHNMTTLELDTVVTKNKNLIIFHDVALNGEICLDANGKPADSIMIKTLTVAQLKSFDCGSLKHKDFPDQVTVPVTRLITLPELFEFIKDYEESHPKKRKMLFNIELKFPETYPKSDIIEGASILVKTIEKFGLTDRVTIQCFVIDMLPEVKKLNPAIKTSALFQPTMFQGIRLYLGFKVNSEQIIELTEKAGADIISPYFLYVTEEFVSTCHEKGIQVLPWTVNDEKTMTRLFEKGVDGIISDYPDKLFNAHQKWLKSL